MKLTDPLRQHAEQKLKEPVEKLLDSTAAAIEIELSETGQNHDNVNKRCRVSLNLPKLAPITVSEEDSDLYRAIDKAHDILLTQVKRAIDKRREALVHG